MQAPVQQMQAVAPVQQMQAMQVYEAPMQQMQAPVMQMQAPVMQMQAPQQVAYQQAPMHWPAASAPIVMQAPMQQAPYPEHLIHRHAEVFQREPDHRELMPYHQQQHHVQD